MEPLLGIKGCVFDAYGTLFDVHSAVKRQGAHLGAKAAAVSQTWRQKQLEYTWLRSLMQRHADFQQVTREALEFALASQGVENPGLAQQLMAAYLELDCYPEVPEALEKLKKAGNRTAILSNGSPDMLAAGARASGILPHLDEVLSVEEVGVYKTDPRVYGLVEQRLGVSPRETAFMSSNYWDVCGASVFGFQVVWVNRSGQLPDRLPGGPDRVIDGLAQLPPLVGV